MAPEVPSRWTRSADAGGRSLGTAVESFWLIIVDCLPDCC